MENQPKTQAERRGWAISNRHLDMRVARWAGMTHPSEWDSSSRDDRAELTMFYLAEHAMERYEYDHPPKEKK